MPLSPRRRLMLALTAVAATAGAAVAVQSGAVHLGDDDPVATVARTPAAVVSGFELAGALSQTSPLRTSAATLDADTLALVAAQQSVDTDRAWPLEIPDDDRTAWLFAGRSRVALLVPRTVVGPDGEPRPDAFSVFGARIADLRDRPLVASQAGGGQEPRTLVLVPAGVAPPRIVARDSRTQVREMPRRGRLYAARIGPDEQLVVDSRRIDPTEID
jgi:hypothetical protein